MTSVGARLGVDVGSVRVGVALSDRAGILASPLVTLARDSAGETDLVELGRLAAEYDVVEIVIGLPRDLRGVDGIAATSVRAYAAALAAQVGTIPVVFVDERMTSVTANRVLADRGIRAKSRRAIVDQVAAVEILQTRLDELRRR